MPNDRFDLVVDATGVPALMGRTTEWARPGGRILLFGVPPSGSRLSLDAFTVFRKGLCHHVLLYLGAEFHPGRQMLRTGRIDVSRLVSHELPLEHFVAGVETIERGAEGVLKVLMAPGGA